MNMWEVTYTGDYVGYVEALTFVDAMAKVGQQNWNQDPKFIVRVALVDNGNGPAEHVVDGAFHPREGLRMGI